MSLTISSIEFYQFRNYPQFTLDDIGGVTVFVGENAVGKTNILEGIHLLTACQSFRHATSEQLVCMDVEEKQSRIAAHLSDEQRSLLVEMCIDQNKRIYKLNGKTKRTTELKGLAPSVVFTPDDLVLAKGAQSDRRSTLDALGSQLTPNHHTVRVNFEEVMRHKNRLLKDGADEDLILSIDEMLVTCGAQLTFYRYSLFQRFVPLFQARYQSISGGKEELRCAYIPSWVEHGKLTAEELQNGTLTRDECRRLTRLALERRHDDEVVRQRMIIGPQADKLMFYLNDKPVEDFASQGQQRSIVLAWKLAEVDIIREILGQNPILLLDDVMSELDKQRRAALETCIQDGCQTFITTTNLGYFSEEALAGAKVVDLPLN